MVWTTECESLVGEWVILEPLQRHHIPGLTLAACDPEMSRHLLMDMAPPGAVERWVTRSVEARGRHEAIPFAIASAATGALVGSTCLFELDAENRKLEIGQTWMTPAVWHTGVNTECKLLLLRKAFEVMHCIRVQLKTDVLNQRSRRAIERLGAQLEGIHRNERIRRDGTFRDTAFYSLIDSEWPAARQELERRLRRDAGASGVQVVDGTKPCLDVGGAPLNPIARGPDVGEAQGG
jgi:RimJ/RimL family protein N-acetyltransferase